jgi:hypothetical protein
MKDQAYNGWTNYETWCVNLWISNDRMWRDEASCQNADAAQLAEMMKEQITSALDNVNWREIAESIIENTEAINA